MPRSRFRGNIESRGPNTYRIRIYLGKGADGKKKYHRETFHGTKTEAKKRLTEILRALDTGGYVEPTKMTVGEWMERWLRDYVKPSTKPRTYEGYEMYVQKHVVPTLGHIALSELKPYMLQKLYADKLSEEVPRLGRTRSPSTIRQLHRIIHKALEDAVAAGLLARNVADAAKPPRPRKREIKVWTQEEVVRFLRYCRSHRLYPFFLLAITTGMSRSELVGLRWQDVDLTRGLIHVRQSIVETREGRVVQTPKSENRIRTIKIGPLVVAALKSHSVQMAKERLMMGSRFEDHGLVFCQINGRPINAHNTSSRLFKRLCEEAGVPVINFHALRHTHATTLQDLGLPVKAVQERLGHSEGYVTLGYSHVLPSTEERAAMLMDELVARANA